MPSRSHPLHPLGSPCRHLDRVGSTMTEAAAWAAAGAPHGATVTARMQTAGRGRHGRVWTAEPGECLLVSVVLRPALPPDRLALVGLAGGLAVAETAETFGADVRLKWPNDVLVRVPGTGGFAKLAGVLAEASWTGAQASVVLGIGLNVRQTSFPDEARAGSLRMATGRDVDRLAPLAPLLDRLTVRLIEAETAPARLLAAIEGRLVGIGEARSVRFPGTGRPALAGTILGLAADGALRLKTANGEEQLHAGEVTLAR